MYRATLLFMLFFSCLLDGLFCQLPAEPDRSLLYKSQWSGGVLIHTRGFGLTLERGTYKTAKRQYLYGLDLIGMSHPKEVKQPRVDVDIKRYKYGKINSFFILRPTVGVNQRLFRKRREQAVEIDFKMAIGPSLGFLKPIYVEVIQSAPLPFILSERYDPVIHGLSRVQGRSSGYKGLGELKFIPGAHFKTGFMFEYDPEDDGIQALEVGAALDFFGQRVPIMVDKVDDDEFANDFLFTTLYLRIIFGRKHL